MAERKTSGRKRASKAKPAPAPEVVDAAPAPAVEPVAYVYRYVPADMYSELGRQRLRERWESEGFKACSGADLPRPLLAREECYRISRADHDARRAMEIMQSAKAQTTTRSKK